MVALVTGVDFVNKGAELMLHAISQQVRSWGENSTVVADLATGSFRQRLDAGLGHFAWRDVHRFGLSGVYVHSVIRCFPAFLRRRLKIWIETEVDVVLDASGFSYSDQWGPEYSEHMASLYRRWKRQGKKIVLLPQALGPFEDCRVRDAFLRVLQHVDLVFARDDISYQHVRNLGVRVDHVKKAPDFTNLVQGEREARYVSLAGRACIVPNLRMLDKTPAEVKASYVPFLVSCAEFLESRGFDPFLLVHEAYDEELARTVCEQHGNRLEVVVEPDPRVLKGIIGQCSLLVGSRFHALISGLTQNVPCLATGWSHKYETLFKEYECSEWVVSPTEERGSLMAKLERFCSPEQREQIERSLASVNEFMTQQVRLMWGKVQETIGEAARGDS